MVTPSIFCSPFNVMFFVVTRSTCFLALFRCLKTTLLGMPDSVSNSNGLPEESVKTCTWLPLLKDGPLYRLSFTGSSAVSKIESEP